MGWELLASSIPTLRVCYSLIKCFHKHLIFVCCLKTPCLTLFNPAFSNSVQLADTLEYPLKNSLVFVLCRQMWLWSFVALCWGSPRPPSASMMCSEDSQVTTYSCPLVPLLAMICHGEGYRAKGPWETALGMKSRGNAAQAARSPFPVGSHRMCLIALTRTCDNTCEMLPPGRPTGDGVPRLFLGSWRHRHSLPGTYQSSRLPEGRHVFRVNCRVHTGSLGHLTSSGKGGDPPEIHVQYLPRANLVNWPSNNNNQAFSVSSLMVEYSFIHSFYICLNQLGGYNKSSIAWVACKQQRCISLSSGD